MSTATYDRPLYAAPAPPEQKARFAYLIAARRRVHRAFDAVLALPRAAAGWALRHLRPLLGTEPGHRLLGWASARLRSAAALVQGVGLVPLAASVLSTPPVWRGTVRLARTVGSALAAAGRGLWARTRSLLGRCGTTGARITQALTRAGTALASAARAALRHPAAQPITQAVTGLAGLVRPLSQGVVAHRLLGLRVPATWLRVALELLALPLVLAPDLPGQVRSRLRQRPTLSAVAQPDAPAVPHQNPTASAAPDPEGNGDAAAATEWDDMPLPGNRAERRAHQQEMARSRKARPRH